MNKNLSKIFSIVLVVMILISAFPVSAVETTGMAETDMGIATPDSALRLYGKTAVASVSVAPDGLFTENGKTYYSVNGVLATGWQNIGDDWYYFDENHEGVNGKRVFGGIEYSFTNGLVEGVWKYDGTGTRYYYGPSYYHYTAGVQLGNYTWATIKGKTYAFDEKGYRYEGYAVLIASTKAKLYEFTDEGVLVGEYSPGSNYTGLFTCQRSITYLKNGVPLAAGLVKEGNDYYYINSTYEPVKGNYEITRTNGLLLPGFYQFAKDGKMIDPPVYADGPNKDGSFYRNGVRLTAYQLVEFEGKYYFISDYNKYARNITLNLDDTFVKGTGLTPGNYYFDADGVMSVKNGPDADGYFYLDGKKVTGYQIISYEGDYYFISDGNKYAKSIRLYLSARFTEGTDLKPDYYSFDADGKLISTSGPNSDGYFYLNGVRQRCYQLIEYNGNYYFINDGHKYAKDITLYLSARFVDSFGLSVGYYSFDKTGKMISQDGPRDDGYFYLNGVRQKAYQLVEYNGDYYFVNAGHKYAKNCSIYLSAKFITGTGFTPGYYEFDADGKMRTMNGPNENGYFYLNGVRQNCYQLVKYKNHYYFINDGHKYAKNCTIYLSAKFVNGTDLKVGYYSFDEAGKLITLNGPNSDGYFYLNGVKQNCYQLIEYDGSYYFISDGHKYAKNCTINLSAKYVSGTDLQPGYYSFDETGKLITLNGPNSDGYFYLNGVRQKCYQLILYNGRYYFINDGNKYAKNCTVYLSSRFVAGTGLTVGNYYFNADGTMATQNGPDADGYFYINGVKQKAYQLVKYNGDYYFINDGNKIAKNRTIYCSDKFIEGTDLRRWDYWFDADGKMVGYYEGIPNGRDIGEIYFMKTSDGRDIKPGLLMRGGELDNANYYYPNRLVEIGIDRIKNEFNVKLDLDLRAASSTGKDLFGSDVAHKTYDMVLYDQILTDKGKSAIKEIFTDLANPDNYPVYLHCTHGIDRTGIVCSILEMALGVPYSAVFDEYLMSVGAHDGSFIKIWNAINDNYSGATEKDKAIAYLKDCGITQEQIDSLYDIYLD